MAFKSYASPGKFNPRKVQDQTQQMIDNANYNRRGMDAVHQQSMANQKSVQSFIKEGDQIELQSRQKAFDQDTKNKELARKQIMRNYEIEMNDLKVEGQQEQEKIKLLTGLSQTAIKSVQEFSEQREKGMQEAFAMAVYESGATTEEMVAIVRNDTAWTNESYKQNAALKAMADRGVSVSQINYLRRMGSGADRYMKSKALIQNTVAQAPLAFESLKDKKFEIGNKSISYNDAIAANEPELVQALQSRISQDYIRSSGLSSMNPELIGTLAYPKLHRYWEKENNALSSTYRRRAADEAREGINRSFSTAYTSDGLRGSFQVVTDAPNRKDARADWTDWVSSKAKSGQLDDDQLAEIGNMPVTIGNHTKTFKEWYPEEFAEIQSGFDAGYRRRKDVETRWIAEREQQAKAAELEVADLLTSKPNLTQKDIEDAKELLQKKFGGIKFSRLDDIQTVDSSRLKEQEREVQAMAEDGSLTLEELSKYDYRIFNKYQNTASRNSKARSDTNSYKAQKDAIKELVKSQAFISATKGVSTDGGYTVPLKTAELTRKFEKRRAQLQAQYPDKDPVEIANEAVHQVRTEFLNEVSTPEYQKAAKTAMGYPDMLDATIDTTQEALKANTRLGQIQGNLSALGGRALQNTGLIVNQAEASYIEKNYGQPGWQPSAAVKYTADILGITPTQVINAQLQALNDNAGTNYSMLGEPPSIEAVNSNVPAEVRSILQRYPSSNRSTRGLGASNKFMPEVVPHGYGEYIQDSSTRYGVNPSAIAALAQIESSFNANAVSPTGAWGVMQIQGDMHPEYTGGADPQANIDYGAKYYSELVTMFGGNEVIAAGAYNVGPGAMQDHIDNGTPLPAETVEHMRRFTQAQYKYGKQEVLTQARTMRPSQSRFTMMSTAASFIGMDTTAGPDDGNNACVWALNKVMRASGVSIPWGNSVYVPEVKSILDQKGTRVEGPQPGAIAIMQDNGNPPYPHIGIVGPDGLIISNSSSRGRFDWQGTPAEYEQKYGRPNLYYMI